MFGRFKNRAIKIRSYDIEPHEILLDKLARKREKDFGISEKKLEVLLVNKTVLGFFYFSIILILFLFLRTFQLQIIEGKNLQAKADENKYIFHKIQAQRGVIYDRNLQQLVFNRPSFDLVCNKDEFSRSAETERKKIFNTAASISKINPEELKKKISESKDSTVLVAENIDNQSLIIFETKAGELPGFKIEQNSVRDYKEGEFFSHLLGYTGKIKGEEIKAEPEAYSILDYVGREGLEGAYEEILRKNPGKLKVEVDAKGNTISKETISFPQSGKSLVLSLDAGLQKKIIRDLEKKLGEIGAKKAAAVALDPKTGAVLSLVSLPGFDNNLFNKGSDQKELSRLLDDSANNKPLFNRAISGRYLTGSIIKPLIAAAALEEKIISPEKEIDAQGKILIKDYWNPEKIWEYKDWAVHGWTDIRKAIAESVNVYFYTIGGGYGDQKGLGPTNIKKYLQLFGWDQKTGIDLPGEAAGFIPDKEWKKRVKGQGWWDGDTYYLSIGQQYLKITPLEVASSFAAIANGGKLFKPKIVQRITDEEKNTIQEIKPEIIRENFIAPQNLQIVREGMRQAVTGQNSPLASAVLLNSLPVPAAAKTGTAELGNDYYNNWITVFAPYDDPQIVLTIVIENVKGLQGVAVPVAKEVLNWYFGEQKTKNQ